LKKDIDIDAGREVSEVEVYLES